MKKALPVLVIAIVGIAAHFVWHPDIATVSSHFLAGQVAQGLVPASPAPVPERQPSIPMNVPASTILALVIAGVATLVYVGYTWGDTFKRK